MHSPYLMVHDKHNTYALDNEKGVEWAALELLKRRVEEGYWYDNWDEKGKPQYQWEDRAKAIVEAEDADKALKFLLSREDFEYEYVEVKH